MNKELAMVITDTRTGEVVNEIMTGDSFSITRAATKQYLIDTQKDFDMESINGNFIKLFLEATKIIADSDLTALEYKMCFAILPYIRYGSGFIAYDNGKPMTTKDIVKATGFPQPSVYKGMQGLMKRGIISRYEHSKIDGFVVNPFVFMKGSKINLTLKNMFIDSAWKHNNLDKGKKCKK